MKWWRIYSGISYIHPRPVAYEDDAGAAAEAAGAEASKAVLAAGGTAEEAVTAAEAAKVKSRATKTGDKAFSQDEVNRFLADDRRKHDKKVVQLADELKQLREEGLSPEDKQKLEERIERVRQDHLTAEQKAKEKSNAQTNAHKEEREKITKDRDVWKGLYSKEVIGTTIIRAATAPDNDAFNPEQIVSILEPQAYLVEGLDEEGTPDGSYIPKIKYATKDDADKDITLELTIPEVVKRMRETPERFGNLFKTTAKSGLGQTSLKGKTGKGLDLNDPAAYRQHRKEHGPPKVGGEK